MRRQLLGIGLFLLSVVLTHFVGMAGEGQAAQVSAICVGTGCCQVKRYYDNVYVCSYKYTCPAPVKTPRPSLVHPINVG